jgi:SOS response regulatory protein OraA/RecX
VPWRVVPVDAAVRAGLAAGRLLDRETARALGRELRRAEALGAAVRALRHRDLSRSRLDERLEARGAAPAARAAALAALERSGVVDDARVAASRAQALAGRGWGDEAIRAALEAEGLAAEHAAAAVGALEPEAERARALLVRRGAVSNEAGPKTLALLARRGFDPALLEELAGFAEDGSPRYDPTTAPPDILPAN